MDNLSAHKVEGIEEMIKANGAKVIYLSPYSPDFNPIENLWSKLKEYLRSLEVRSREDLELAINKGLEMITLQNLKSRFTHCLLYLTRMKTAIDNFFDNTTAIHTA